MASPESLRRRGCSKKQATVLLDKLLFLVLQCKMSTVLDIHAAGTYMHREKLWWVGTQTHNRAACLSVAKDTSCRR